MNEPSTSARRHRLDGHRSTVSDDLGTVPEALDDARYRFGRQTLGPIFAAFARLLLARARDEGVRRLVFVARDGEFLRLVVQTWLDERPEPMALEDLRASRRATNLMRGPVDIDALREALSVRAGSPDAGAALRGAGIELDGLPSALLAQLPPAGQRWDEPAMQRLLADAVFNQAVQQQRERVRRRLARYLAQQRLVGERDVALVDIGWRGSIVANLQAVLPASAPPLRAFQLGLWSEQGAEGLPRTAAQLEGVLGDVRRGRNRFEAAAFRLALVLEAVCREAVAPVSGYREDASGWVSPFGDAEPPQHERANAAWREPIRRGVLDAVIEQARSGPREPPGSAESLRREAQVRMRRLAFHPTAAELAACRGLLHSESHQPGWSSPLVGEPVRPWRSIRGWVAGLTAPWRAGYVAASAGWPGAWMFDALDRTLLALPPSLGERLAAWARRFSRV